MMKPRHLLMQIMQGMAEALLRRVARMQAHDLAREREKTRDDCQDRQDSSITPPSSGPPQHWLKLVRRYAPELLQSPTVMRADADVVRVRPRATPSHQATGSENVLTTASHASDNIADTTSVSGNHDSNDKDRHHEPQQQKPRPDAKRHEYFSRRLSLVKTASRPVPKKPFTAASEAETVEGGGISSRRLFLATTRQRDKDAIGPVVAALQQRDTSSPRQQVNAVSASGHDRNARADKPAGSADDGLSVPPDPLQLLVSAMTTDPSTRSGPERSAPDATDKRLMNTTVSQDSQLNKHDDSVTGQTKRTSGMSGSPLTSRSSNISLVHPVPTGAPAADSNENLPDWPLLADESQNTGDPGEKGHWPGLQGSITTAEADPDDKDRARTRERLERLQREQRGDLWNA